MLLDYHLGQTSVVFRVKVRNSSVQTGAGLTGLTNASSGLVIAAIADNEATTTAYTAAGSTIDTITTLGTYAAPTAGHCRFKEVDATNHPGVYEVQLENSRFAVASAKSLLVSLSGATNMAQCDVVIPLRTVNPYDANFGLANLDAAVSSRMATFTLPANFSSFSVDASGRVDVGKILGTASAGSAGHVGIDWGQVANQNTSVVLSGTTISTSQAVASVSGSVASVTGNVGGNVVGSVASVTAAVTIDQTKLLGAPRDMTAVADSATTISDALWAAIGAGAGQKDASAGTSETIRTPSTGTLLRTYTLTTVAGSPTSYVTKAI